MKKSTKNILITLCCIISACAVIVASINFIQYKSDTAGIEAQDFESADQTDENKPPQNNGSNGISDPEYTFEPYCVDSTNPENFGLKTQIYSGYTEIDSYQQAQFDLGYTNAYSPAEGIVTFKGNNFRDGAVYGKTTLKEKSFSDDFWRVQTGSMASGSGYPAWTGSGWTGQPLVVKWDETTKNNMNIYPEKKEKSDLTEVIYATMGGTIYFIDLDDGSYTRDPLDLGFVFKGAGALDPRGYPIMYVGGGDYTPGGTPPKMFIISLIDCTILKEYSGSDSVAYRTWCAFDSSALVCAATDTLVYPCENGLIYTIHLNTSYDATNGTLSINPDEPIKLRVTTSRSNSVNFWYGFETSPVIYGQYMYIADNGGYLYCIDMRTLSVVWMQDVVDDTNCSPVLDIENGKPYIYISTSLHWTTSAGRGDIPVFKIDAETGEIVWQKAYNCTTVEGTSGGVQGTIALGKNDCSHLIFVPLAHYPNVNQGGIAAIDKSTGEEVWYYTGNMYTWSSPCVVTGKDGKSVIINGDLAGDIVMLDAKTGELLDKICPGGLIEASPVVYNNKLVFGLRSSSIVGIDLL